jgi:hypothetical protein
MYKTRKKKTDPKQEIRNRENEIGCLYVYIKRRERERNKTVANVCKSNNIK